MNYFKPQSVKYCAHQIKPAETSNLQSTQEVISSPTHHWKWVEMRREAKKTLQGPTAVADDQGPTRGDSHLMHSCELMEGDCLVLMLAKA